MDDYAARTLRDYDWSLAQPNPPAPPEPTPCGHYWLRESDGVTVCQICGEVK